MLPKRDKKREAPKVPPKTLKDWKEISEFLGHPAAVVQRWASEGMPVQRQGRFVTTTPDDFVQAVLRLGVSWAQIWNHP